MALPSPKYAWNFNEQSGTAAAAAAGGATIALDREGVVAGRSGNGLRFKRKPGVRLATTTPIELPPPWTVAFWVKRGADSEGASLFRSLKYANKLEQWLSTRKAGLTHFGGFDEAFACTARVGEWVHLALVGTATETRLYLNGA